MKITKQSIEWLGDGQVRIRTTRSATARAVRFHIWFLSFGGGTSRRRNTTTNTIQMDHRRYLVERELMKRGQFKEYDPTKHYKYDENVAYFPEEKTRRLFKAISGGLMRVVSAIQNPHQTLQEYHEHRRDPSLPQDETLWLLMIAALGTVSFFIGADGTWLWWLPLIVGVMVPILVSYDVHRVTTHTDYSPNERLWTVAAAIPIVGAFVGLLYGAVRTHHVPLSMS